MSRFTVLIPVHNEADNIAPLHAELARELGHLDHEVIVINDGSTDSTGAELARHAPEWTVINTPRLGKSRALEKGLAHVSTDRVVMMDGDLQDDTTAIPALLADLDAGADCAVGCRAGRKDGWLIKRFPSFFFNLFLSLLFGFRFLDINTGLKAFRTDSLRSLVWFENCHRFFPLLVLRQGGRVTQRPTHHRARHAGEAKFNSPLRFLGGFTQGMLLRLGRHDAAPVTTRLARVLPWMAALAAGACFFYWAANDWYFANYDCGAFIPPMLSYAQSGELINTFQPSALLWDPLGQGRQVGHGFLPGIFAGAFAPGSTYRDIHYVIAGQMLAGLIMYVLLLGRLAPVRPRRAFITALLHTLAVVASAYILINLDGRPEPFVFFVVTIAAWLFLSFDVLGKLITAGLTLSILAVSHPIAAVITGLGFLAYLAAALPGKTSWQAWGAAAIATLAGLCVWFSIYPYSIADWVRGHLRHAGQDLLGLEAGSLLPWLIDPSRGLRGTLFFIALAVTLTALWKHRRRLAHVRMLTGCAAVFAVVVWYFALRQGFPVYNIDWLTPFGLAFVLALWCRAPGGWRHTLAGAGLVLALLPALLSFTGEQVIRYSQYRSGPPPDEVRSLVTTFLSEDASQRTVLVSGQYFQLLDNHPRLHRVTKNPSLPLPPDSAFLLVSQADMRGSQPLKRSGWRLIRHTYDPAPVRLAGLTLAGIRRGFHYALYLPEDAPTPPALSALLSQLQANGNESNASSQ